VQKWLFNKLDKDNNFGARPILRLIQTEIENKLIDEILENPEKKEFYMEIENNVLKIS
jgi:ATP-dependent Clp protease ATP-binding subunit ClpA